MVERKTAVSEVQKQSAKPGFESILNKTTADGVKSQGEKSLSSCYGPCYSSCYGKRDLIEQSLSGIKIK